MENKSTNTHMRETYKLTETMWAEATKAIWDGNNADELRKVFAVELECDITAAGTPVLYVHDPADKYPKWVQLGQGILEIKQCKGGNTTVTYNVINAK